MRCLSFRCVYTILVAFMYETSENVWADVYKAAAGPLQTLTKRVFYLWTMMLIMVDRVRWVPSPIVMHIQWFMMMPHGNDRAEGCCNELQLQRELGSPGKISKPASFKRSWQRVVRRVISQGRAQYRGKWYRRAMLSEFDISRALSSLSGRHSRQADQSTPKERPPRNHTQHTSHQRTLSYLSVNCGGLAASKMDELLLWCSDHDIQLLAVQETRWSSSLQWSSGDWNLIHSAPEPKPGRQSYSGVLFAYRGSCKLRFQEVIAGRLLRVQIYGATSSVPLEVIIAYNHYLPLEASRDVDGYRASGTPLLLDRG